MVLKILQCGHPALREKGKRIDRVTPAIRQLASDMIETMHAANGVGLAAQQVGHPLMLAVIDVRGSEQPSELWLNGQPKDVNSLMPLILLNPRITSYEGEQS
ncbi:MAG: peptide deformylase, partial [Verrucomicrobiae bacterium]|nr:peptide deformylase [Verrucomicrobiae bacterium]